MIKLFTQSALFKKNVHTRPQAHLTMLFALNNSDNKKRNEIRQIIIIIMLFYIALLLLIKQWANMFPFVVVKLKKYIYKIKTESETFLYIVWSSGSTIIRQIFAFALKLKRARELRSEENIYMKKNDELKCVVYTWSKCESREIKNEVKHRVNLKYYTSERESEWETFPQSITRNNWRMFINVYRALYNDKEIVKSIF